MICELHNCNKEATKLVVGKLITVCCCEDHSKEFPRDWNVTALKSAKNDS